MIAEFTRPMAVEARVFVLIELVPSDSAVRVSVWAATVITDEASELARALIVVPPCLIRLPPLNSALLTALVIWPRMDLYSSARAVRLVESRPASAAESAFSFSCRSRSEMVSPAEIATSAVD